MFDRILYVCTDDVLPKYLEKYKDVVRIYIMNLNMTPENMDELFYEFLCVHQFNLIISEQQCAFYVRMITGAIKLLINPILQPTERQLFVQDYYLNSVYGQQNKFENIGWFTNKKDVNIKLFNNLYMPEHLITKNIVDLNDRDFIEIIKDVPKGHFID